MLTKRNGYAPEEFDLPRSFQHSEAARPQPGPSHPVELTYPRKFPKKRSKVPQFQASLETTTSPRRTDHPGKYLSIQGHASLDIKHPEQVQVQEGPTQPRG